MQDVHEIAASIASHLGEIDGVAAVALGGSWAQDESQLDGDIDLSIYYRDERRPDVEEMRALALQLNSFLSAETVTDFWQQGPLLNGGAWLWVEGRRVNWQYRDLARIQAAIENARAGGSTGFYQLGHPHGFFSHYYLGELAYCKPLYDPSGILRQLKHRVEVYPQPLKRSLAEGFIKEADLTLFAAQRAVSQGDIFYASGCLYRAVACLVQVLHAVNERYITGERMAIESVMKLEERPPDFDVMVAEVLSRFGSVPDARLDAINRLRGAAQQIQIEHVNPLIAGG